MQLKNTNGTTNEVSDPRVVMAPMPAPPQKKADEIVFDDIQPGEYSSHEDSPNPDFNHIDILAMLFGNCSC